MLRAIAFSMAALLGGTPDSVLVIPPEAQVCVSATIDSSLVSMSRGKDFDASTEFASRLEQLYLRRGGASPQAIAGTPTVKFDGYLGRDTLCKSTESPRIILRYKRLPNGQPYQMSYSIYFAGKTLIGVIKQDLSQRPGLGNGILDAPWSPTADIINNEMTEHARQILNDLKL